MNYSGRRYQEDDLTQLSVSPDTCGWIQVRRRHHAASTSNSWTGGQGPPMWDASGPSTGKQPLIVEDIVALVHQFGPEDPWDGLAAVQAQQTTTANRRDTQSAPVAIPSQEQTFNYDTERQRHTNPGAGYIGSTRADHGSQESQGRLKPDSVDGDSRARKPKRHSKGHSSRK